MIDALLIVPLFHKACIKDKFSQSKYKHDTVSHKVKFISHQEIHTAQQYIIYYPYIRYKFYKCHFIKKKNCFFIMFQISIYCHNITLLFYTFLFINYRKELSATEHDKLEWKTK